MPGSSQIVHRLLIVLPEMNPRIDFSVKNTIGVLSESFLPSVYAVTATRDYSPLPSPEVPGI